MAITNDPNRPVNPSRVTEVPARVTDIPTGPAPAVTPSPQNPPPVLGEKFAYRPTARFGSPIARAETISCRYGNKTLGEFAHQAAEAYDGGVRDPRFENDMGTVLANRGLV